MGERDAVVGFPRGLPGHQRIEELLETNLVKLTQCLRRIGLLSYVGGDHRLELADQLRALDLDLQAMVPTVEKAIQKTLRDVEIQRIGHLADLMFESGEVGGWREGGRS